MMEVVVTTGAVSYKAPVKSSPPTNQHPSETDNQDDIRVWTYFLHTILTAIYPD